MLRSGADGPEVLERLKSMRECSHQSCAGARGRRPLRSARSARPVLALGDEARPRTKEGTAITLAPLGIEHPEVRAFIAGNGKFFLDLAMVFSKLALDCARGRAGLAGPRRDRPQQHRGRPPRLRHGDQWFVGPAALPHPAKLFDGYTPADVDPGAETRRSSRPTGWARWPSPLRRSSAPSVGLDPATIDEIDTELRAIAAGESPDIKFPDGRAAIRGRRPRGVAARGSPRGRRGT